MKKFLSLIVMILCLFLVGCSNKSNMTSNITIEEITGVNFSEILYIKTGDALNHNEDYSVKQFIEEYKNLHYIKITGSIGSTAHTYYVCYDANDEVLFTLVDIGNQDKFYIKKGNFDINEDNTNNLYQLNQ